MYMVGAVDIAFSDLKKSETVVQEKDSRVKELEKELQILKISKDLEVSGLQNQIKDEKDWADREAAELKSEVASLKEQLSEKDEEAIIAKFKQSDEYDQALANAGALEVERCWIIAEKHIKINPGANWTTFVEEFLNAKDNIKKGLGEPEPYDGPTPAFHPGPPPHESA